MVKSEFNNINEHDQRTVVYHHSSVIPRATTLYVITDLYWGIYLNISMINYLSDSVFENISLKSFTIEYY